MTCPKCGGRTDWLSAPYLEKLLEGEPTTGSFYCASCDHVFSMEVTAVEIEHTGRKLTDR